MRKYTKRTLKDHQIKDSIKAGGFWDCSEYFSEPDVFYLNFYINKKNYCATSMYQKEFGPVNAL